MAKFRGYEAIISILSTGINHSRNIPNLGIMSKLKVVSMHNKAKNIPWGKFTTRNKLTIITSIIDVLLDSVWRLKYVGCVFFIN